MRTIVRFGLGLLLLLLTTATSSPAQQAVPPPRPGSGTGANALVWATPTAWIREAPTSRMRRAQYRVPGPGGPAELVVFYFGPGQGGDPMANAARWGSQFTQPDGRPPAEALRTSRLDVAGLPVLLVETSGTYSGGMPMGGGPTATFPNSMLLGAIAQGPDANWFFKLTGPKATVEAQRGAFDVMVRSLKRGK